MNKLETFLESHFYPLIVCLLAFVAWAADGPYQFVNYGIVVLFLLTSAILMALFKDTSHAIPLFFRVNVYGEHREIRA